MIMKRVLLPLLLISAALWTGCSKDEITTTDGSSSGTSETATGTISWSASTCTVTYGDESTYSFPTLDNPGNQSITYASSNTGVATVSTDGTVTVTGQGETTISATSAASGSYKAATVSYALTVEGDLEAAGLSWSASTCTAVLEEDDNTYPTLSNPNGLSVSYSSSNTSVATISSGGKISLVAVGSTTIYATSAATDTYAAGSASFTLTVKTNTDDGAGTWTFSTTGDSSSEDDIANTTFTRMVTVTYASSGATVTGYAASSDLSVSVSGNQVTVTNSGEENIIYLLTGTASDGFFKLYSEHKQAIQLSDLSLSCSSGAAINNQSGKRTFVVVEGTNTLADGSSASYSTTGTEDMKGVFFSEGQLVFSGSGSLKVTANNKQGKAGISSDDYVRFMNSPSVTVSAGSSAGNGIRGNDCVQLSGGTLNITTAAAMKKGISSDGYVLVEGGTATITVSGGTAYDSDEGEYKGSAGIKADNYFGMTGGTVTITNSGTGGKGIRAGSYTYYKTNGSIADSYISGGTLTIKTTGSESNGVSCKGIKIGFKEGSGRSYVYGGNMTVSGGSINVTVSKSEGFETKGTLTFTGGDTYVYSTGDDAINSQGELNIKGGYVYAYSTANDGIDTNCDMKLSGGVLFAITTKGSPEVAVDANTEGGYKLYINSGATVIAYGGLESGYSASQSVYSMSATAGSWNALYNGSSFIAAFKAPSSLSSFAVSAPNLSSGYKGVSVSGTTYCNSSLAASGISGGTSVTLSTYSGGSGGGPGGGGRPGGGW